MRTLGEIKEKGASREYRVKEIPDKCLECGGELHYTSWHPHQEGEPCGICAKCDIAYLVYPW